MKNLFGTDGIRALMGDYPLTHEGLYKLGTVIGSWAHAHNKARIIIATDTRISATFCKYALISGLVQFPIMLHDGGILPTPVLHYLVQKYEYDYGIIITASHNNADYNGIKIVTKEGKLSDTEQMTLEAHHALPISPCNYSELGQAAYLPHAFNLYQEALNRNFQANFLKNIKIVIDCAHGAWSQYAEIIFKHFGAHVISLASSGPNNNINKECGSLYPHNIQQAVIKHEATIGIAFDGDGDRIIVVNKAGIIKDGDDILSMLIHHPRYKKNSAIVGTSMTNEGVADYMNQYNKTLVRVAVGDAHVLEELKRENLTLGGEPSGHIIARDFSESADALFVALRLLETMILTYNMDLTTFSKYPQELINLPVTVKKDLDTENFKAFLKEHAKVIDKSRIMIRYSGTEPVVRILVEYNNQEDKEIVQTKLLPSLSHYFV